MGKKGKKGGADKKPEEGASGKDKPTTSQPEQGPPGKQKEKTPKPGPAGDPGFVVSGDGKQQKKGKQSQQQQDPQQLQQQSSQQGQQQEGGQRGYQQPQQGGGQRSQRQPQAQQQQPQQGWGQQGQQQQPQQQHWGQPQPQGQPQQPQPGWGQQGQQQQPRSQPQARPQQQQGQQQGWGQRGQQQPQGQQQQQQPGGGQRGHQQPQGQQQQPQQGWGQRGQQQQQQPWGQPQPQGQQQGWGQRGQQQPQGQQQPGGGQQQLQGQQPWSQPQGQQQQPQQYSGQRGQQQPQQQPQQSSGQPRQQGGDQRRQHPSKSQQQLEAATKSLDISETRSALGGAGQRVEQSSLKGVARDYAVKKSPTENFMNWCGTAGTSHLIEANYLKLSIERMPNVVYHYDVKFNMERPFRFRPLAFEKLRISVLKRIPIAFDGRNMAFSAVKIPDNLQCEHEVMFIDEETNVEKTIKITLKAAIDCEIDLSALRSYQTTGITDAILRALQALDVVLRTPPSRKAKQAGRAFYDPPKNRIDLNDGFELWLGLFQSLVLGSCPMINVDIAHKGFPYAANCADLLDQRFQEDFFRGLNIIYKPPKVMNGKDRLYKVNGLVGPATTLTFKDENDREITVQKYFASKNYQILKPNLPCLSVGAKKNFLPPELCFIQAGQNVLKRAGANQVRELIKHAATTTTVRKTKIMELFRKFEYNNNEIVRGFNLTIDDKFIQLMARLILPPRIGYKDSQAVLPQKGSWRPMNVKYLKGAELLKWGILVTDNRIRDAPIGTFANMIIAEGQKLDMQIDKNYVLRKETDIRRLSEKIQEFKKAQCAIVFVIIPGFGDNYSKVKKLAEIDHGVLTQCLKANTVERRCDQSTIGNILLKVNSKLNGINHRLVPSPQLSILNDAKLSIMFLGADVTHPSPDQSFIPSVAGVVASHDSLAFQYNVCWRLQNPKVEMIDDMENIMIEQLQYYKSKRNTLPTHIIYYRDGVSDGQFDQLKRSELNAINKACSKIPNYKPFVTCLVVQKRHHTRFFPVDPKIVHPRDKWNNVMPGTVVDKTITHPGDKQFFLVSHESIQGTAKPAKYCIIRDDANFPADQLQALTYSMCHMFTRCNRSVSYPAPAYYAHLVAARGRAYLGNDRININDLNNEYRRRIVKDDIIKKFPMFFV